MMMMMIYRFPQMSCFLCPVSLLNSSQRVRFFQLWHWLSHRYVLKSLSSYLDRPVQLFSSRPLKHTSVIPNWAMGLFFGLVCVFALFTPPCLGAPLPQVERRDGTLHQGEKSQDDMILAAVSFFFFSSSSSFILFDNTLFTDLQHNIKSLLWLSVECCTNSIISGEDMTG